MSVQLQACDLLWEENKESKEAAGGTETGKEGGKRLLGVSQSLGRGSKTQMKAIHRLLGLKQLYK